MPACSRASPPPPIRAPFSMSDFPEVTLLTAPVVVDGKIVTARGPDRHGFRPPIDRVPGRPGAAGPGREGLGEGTLISWQLLAMPLAAFAVAALASQLPGAFAWGYCAACSMSPTPARCTGRHPPHRRVRPPRRAGRRWPAGPDRICTRRARGPGSCWPCCPWRPSPFSTIGAMCDRAAGWRPTWAPRVLLMAGGLGWSRLDLPGLTLNLGTILAVCLTLLLVVWMINLYNFMDGMDGLGRRHGHLRLRRPGGPGLAWAANPVFALAAACVAAAAAGFLDQQFPAGAASFWAISGPPAWACWPRASRSGARSSGSFRSGSPGSPSRPSSSMPPGPCCAGSVAAASGSGRPHRSHHYQRLVLAGWSHRKTRAARLCS